MNNIIETCDKWTGAPRLLAITPAGVVVADLWLGEVSLHAGEIDREGQIDYAEAKREWDGFEPSDEEIASNEEPVNGLYLRAADIKAAMEDAERDYEATKRAFLSLMDKRAA